MESKTKACIINAALGGWYPEGQRRLVRSLVHHGFQFDIKTFEGFANDSYDKANPYNLKPSAFEEAIRQGYSHILWLDCSVWAIQNPNNFFDIINEQGYYLWQNGNNCAQECSDKCLEYFGITRDQAELMPCVSSGVLGVNMLHPTGKEFMEKWLQSAKDGVFDGSRLHDNQSSDPRFLHHRQDQSAASVIANKMGLKIHPMNEHCAYYDNKNLPDSVVFMIKGL